MSKTLLPTGELTNAQFQIENVKVASGKHGPSFVEFVNIEKCFG